MIEPIYAWNTLLLSVPEFTEIPRDWEATYNREFIFFALQFSPSGYFWVLSKVLVELKSFLNLI